MAIEISNLHNIQSFHLLDDDELAELAAHIDEAIFHTNQPIYRAGDSGDELHIVLQGRVQVFILDDANKRVVLEEVEVGEMFGELSLLDNEPRSANAVALEPTHTFIIDRDDLMRLVSKKPAAALDMLSALGHRVRKTDILLQTQVSRNPNEEIEENLSLGDQVADAVARFGGSWNFIGAFTLVMLVWIILNTWVLTHPFDSPPYIGLNLILSMLAALQAPVIMMSQNRQDAKDRIRSELDYKVNLKAELEIMELHTRIDQLQAMLEDHLPALQPRPQLDAGKTGPGTPSSLTGD